MKIEDDCAEKPVLMPFEQIPVGTVFGYLDHKRPFLRVLNGIVDLKENLYYPANYSVVYRGYTPFPAARVVLK